MCGIAGIAYRNARRPGIDILGQMAASLRHRGPDGYGFFTSPGIGLAHVRLSVVDVAGGAQPLGNEDGRIVVVLNGEIYNHYELRELLRSKGHRFRTLSDTEVLVHAYEEWGPAMLDRLNGQFAFAIRDGRSDALFLARDRFGVRPLFYAERRDVFVFASEAKALFASGAITASPDYEGLDEVFTFWAARPPRTPFRGVRILPPGAYAVWRDGELAVRSWHDFDYPEERREPLDALSRLDSLMTDSVRLRMRADVDVGGYLSGGLDSSIVCAAASTQSRHPLHTFSIAFDDRSVDESPFQQRVARCVQTAHAARSIGSSDIGAVFPAVVYHAETPLLRTAPAPLYLLSKLVRTNGIKVVLTGEGADELFLGYDLFKETLIRNFCERQPDSVRRPMLFDRLYPYLRRGARGGELWRRFFLDVGNSEHPLFSHLPRFQLTAWIKQFYSPDMRSTLAGFDPLEELERALPTNFSNWSAVHRAAYLEIKTLLSCYLLASQGDRMAMAHGIEVRFPFLDHNLARFANALPTGSKIQGLREKAILRRWARSLLPPEIVERRKRPYRAPDIPAFFGGTEPEYVGDILNAASIKRSGYFSPKAVDTLVRRCRSGEASSVRESQALVGILSTELWHRQFIERRPRPAPLDPSKADVVWNQGA